MAKAIIRGMAAVVATCLFGASIAQNPRILIVQTRKKDEPALYSVDNFFAQQLDEDGKVISIVWGVTDPIFRAALVDGSLGSVPDRPGIKEAEAAASKLRAEYLAILEVSPKSGQLQGRITVYRQGSQVFKDEQLFSIQMSGQLNGNASAKSLARTWASKLGASVWKSIPSKSKIQPPEIGGAQVTTAESPVAVPVDNKAVVAQADAIRKEAEKEIEALKRDSTDKTKPSIDPAELSSRIALLQASRDQAVVAWYRDAVDAEPLDFDRRRLLIESIMLVDPRDAAREARRSARLLTDHPELRVQAARAWLMVPDEAEAQSDLNEAISRDPEAVSVRLLLAEIGLLKLEADRALEHADKAVKKESNSETHFIRALCRALLGGLDGVKADFGVIGKSGTTPSQNRLALRVLDKSLDESISALKTLIQKGIVKKSDEGVRDGVELLQRTIASRITLLEGLTIPVTTRALYDHLLLAHKLLAQSVIDLRGFLNAEGEDSLNESRINLGEAVRQLMESRGQVPTKG